MNQDFSMPMRDFKDATVVFVDDEPPVLTAMERLLIREPYRKHFCRTGQECVDILEREPVHLVVTDVLMPEMDGLALLKIVKEKSPDTVRMTLSAQIGVPQILAAINSGEVYRYLVKPMNDPNEFRTIIRQALEHHELRRDLKESEERWHFALEGSAEGVWDWNLETNEVFFSEQWKRMLGFEPDEITNSLDEWKDRVHPEELDSVLDCVRQHLEGETPIYVNEHRVKSRNGEYIWVLDRGKVMARKNDGTPLRMVGTHADITERKRSEAVLREMMAMRSKFTSIAAHELRSPLVTMKTAVDLLVEEETGELNSDQRTIVGMIRNNIDRLMRLTTDFLDFKKMEAGKITFNFEKGEINPIVHEVCETSRSLAAQRGLAFKMELDSTVCEVKMDRDKITQVIVNLINNALNYTATGSITIKTVKEEKGCRVIVEDTGAGMSKESVQNLFTPFFQVTQKSLTNVRGTGLGLTICREIVEGHGGEIRAESEPGRGTALSFTLPDAEES